MNSETIIQILPFIMGGFFVGSFLNVLAERLPQGKDVISDRSECTFCHKKLQWYELIPLLSFVVQKGKCRSCHKRLSWLYPAMEVFTGAMFGFIAWNYLQIQPVVFIGMLIFMSSLLVILIADLRYFIIPDSMILAGLFGALLTQYGTPLATILTNGITGVFSLAFFYFLWFITKKKGMGFGDVKFAFLLGFFLGFPKIIIALYLAFLTGAFLAIILVIHGRKTMKSAVPFGPFLILGTVVSLFINSTIIFSYFV